MAISLLFCCCYLLLASAVSAVSGVTPVTYPNKISQCGKGNPLQDEQLMVALKMIKQQLGPPGCNPPMNRSCQEILHCLPSALSGYYQIRAANGSAVQVYCDMEGTNCGGEGGWMRVAYVNMTQPGATCPQGLTQRQFPGLNLCGRSNSGCQGTTFSTFGLKYSQVCGQLRGYHFGSPDGFHPYHVDNSKTIDNTYVEGASITYGSAPRKHIWTYANGLNLGYHPETYACPCNNNSMQQVPPYVGSDYYCETGDNAYPCCRTQIYPNDPLWDGQQCVAEEAPCCTHPNMPWFLKTLSETTTENIELRVCGDSPPNSNEDTPLQVIELFVY